MARDENENRFVPGRRISGVVRAVAEQAAPEELPMVDGLGEATEGHRRSGHRSREGAGVPGDKIEGAREALVEVLSNDAEDGGAGHHRLSDVAAPLWRATGLRQRGRSGSAGRGSGRARFGHRAALVLLVVLLAASMVAMMRTHIVRRISGRPETTTSPGATSRPGSIPSDPSGETSPQSPGGTPRHSTPAQSRTGWRGGHRSRRSGASSPSPLRCWVMPLWKIRRRGLRPVDPTSKTGEALRALAARADVPSACFVVDWASGSMNAIPSVARTTRSSRTVWS